MHPTQASASGTPPLAPGFDGAVLRPPSAFLTVLSVQLIKQQSENNPQADDRNQLAFCVEMARLPFPEQAEYLPGPLSVRLCFSSHIKRAPVAQVIATEPSGTLPTNLNSFCFY